MEKTTKIMYNESVPRLIAVGGDLSLGKGNTMQIKRMLALALTPCLLAGCAVPALPGTAVTPATVETAAPPEPQALTAYVDAVLEPAMTAYAQATGVSVNLTEDAANADLIVSQTAPTGELLDLSGDTLIASAAKRAGVTNEDGAGITVLPLGKSLYGYWADGAVLTALLGEDTAAVALQNASWAEWSDFAETLTAWLEKPSERKVRLNSTDYTLPAEIPAEVAVSGVFAEPVSRSAGYTAALLAAGEERTADTLAGPLNAVYSAITLEYDNAAGDGAGIFTRGQLTEMLAARGAQAAQSLILVPFKCELEDSDITSEEYNLTGLMNYPVLCDVGYLAVNASADEAAQKAAKSAILWLYSSGEGEEALTDTLTVVTPWNTASDKSVLGAMQVTQTAAGILPGVVLNREQAAALDAAESEQREARRNTAARTAYRTAALAALGIA